MGLLAVMSEGGMKRSTTGVLTHGEQLGEAGCRPVARVAAWGMLVISEQPKGGWSLTNDQGGSWWAARQGGRWWAAH